VQRSHDVLATTYNKDLSFAVDYYEWRRVDSVDVPDGRSRCFRSRPDGDEIPSEKRFRHIPHRHLHRLHRRCHAHGDGSDPAPVEAIVNKEGISIHCFGLVFVDGGSDVPHILEFRFWFQVAKAPRHVCSDWCRLFESNVMVGLFPLNYRGQT